MMDPLVLRALKAAAAAYPNQRACQLISNAMPSMRRFFVEDSVLVEALTKYAARGAHSANGGPT